jgi:transcriptional regulator GlxA family with amidase domain
MDRRIQIVIARMEAHVAEPFNLAKLAHEVNLSPSRLRHLFKKETGRTPAQHLRTYRMRKAELLLRTTFLSIKEIINRVGMTNSHFVREFRKTYGTTPTKHRKASRVLNVI